MHPFFSIIMPAYNRADFLPLSTQSVLNQSYADWELIIIDDGSTDHTKEIVENIKDNRIRYFYQRNRGVSAARNLGIEKSRGRYICFLDSDDEYHNNHLQVLNHKIEEKNSPVAVLFTQVYIKDVNTSEKKRQATLYLSGLSFEDLPWTPAICGHYAIFKQEKFNVNLRQREDHELFDRIRRKYPFIKIDNYTITVNKHDNNASGDDANHYTELEKTIFYYIRDRLEMSKKEWYKLNDIYAKLMKIFSDKGDLKNMTVYSIKRAIFFPPCIFKRDFWILIKKCLKQNKSIGKLPTNEEWDF